MRPKIVYRYRCNPALVSREVKRVPDPTTEMLENDGR